MRIAALVKQIPQFEAMTLGADGRLVRDGLELEMNAYCRRAVAEAVELVRGHGGEIVVFTLGPPSADDVLREAIAWGDEHGLAPEQTRGVHVCDTAFAGSDTLATARACSGRARATRAASTSCCAAATRSTPTPARSDRSSPSCSTLRS